MLSLYLTKSLILLSVYKTLVEPLLTSFTELSNGEPAINKAEDELYLLNSFGDE